MKVISTNNCVNCLSAKKILTMKGISFEEVQFEKLSEEDQNKYKNLATEAGLMSFPIIITTDEKVVTLADALTYTELKIVKRNGSEVAFDKDRIIKAINAAISETETSDETLATKIADTISKNLSGRDKVSVEEIQDIIETELMNSDRKDVARRYILYRESRSIERTKTVATTDNSNKLLTDEFISAYKHKKAPFTEFGEFVYYRTYSRWLPNLQRREFWHETVRRAVEYNCSLLHTTREEAEELYDNIFNLRQFLSGKVLPLV